MVSKHFEIDSPKYTFNLSTIVGETFEIHLWTCSKMLCIMLTFEKSQKLIFFFHFSIKHGRKFGELTHTDVTVTLTSNFPKIFVNKEQ